VSKAEILEELLNLSSEERREVLEKLWKIDERVLLQTNSGPSEEEKIILDHELTDYEQNPNVGSDWKTVRDRLRPASPE